MEPLAVDLFLLRSLETPGLRIAPGRALMARVVEADGAGRGRISIAGILLEAALPKTVQTGQELRLVVRDVSAGRVLLSVSDQGAAPPAQESVRLPGGGGVSVTEREASSAGASAGDVHTVGLRYDAPTLGAVDLHFRLDAGSLQVAVTVANGDPMQSAQAAAEGLRETLADSLERAVIVTVRGRHEPLEVYA